MVAVGLCAVVAAAWYAWLLLARDAGLATFGYDQAFFQQLVWNLDHGRWFNSSFSSGSFLGLHFEPLLIVPAAAELAWPDARALSLLAAVSIAGLGPAAFLFIRALTARPWLAAAIAAPLPFWPALQEAGRAGFHPESIGVGLALLAGWAGLRSRTGLCWCLVFLALGAKEDQAWNIVVIGLAVGTLPALRQFGHRLAGLAIVWGVTITGVVMPFIRAGQHVDTANYYRWLVVASPRAIFHVLTLPAGWLTFLVLILCAGALPLLRPAWLAMAAPPMVADLLSAHDPQPLLHLQYALPLVVPVLVAAAMAARAIPSSWPIPMLALPPAILALTIGVLPPSIGANSAAFQRPPALARLQACVGGLPVDAPVAADDTLLARLASRSSLRELTGAQPTDYLVIDREAKLPGYVVIVDRASILLQQSRPVLCDDGRFLVLGPL